MEVAGLLVAAVVAGLVVDQPELVVGLVLVVVAWALLRALA